MKKSLVLALGVFALAMPFSTLAALADEPVLNLYNWSDYRADDTLSGNSAPGEAAADGPGA